jgi:hypothetical protein
VLPNDLVEAREHGNIVGKMETSGFGGDGARQIGRASGVNTAPFVRSRQFAVFRFRTNGD